MKKGLLSALSMLGTVLFLCTLFSCSAEVGDGETGSKSTATGKISGKVTFQNAAESSGIMVTLDKTDGLRTVAVSSSVSARSIVNSARTLVGNAVTTSDGSYLFENLEQGTYTVYASSSNSTEKAVCTNVVVRANETSIADTLRLTATGNISGRITIDGNDSGNTGFLVFVAGTSYMAMTDNYGNYTISSVPAGSWYQVVATKNGIIYNLNSEVFVNANESTSMESFSFSSSELEQASMVWLGSYNSSDEITNPQYLNAYFNMSDGCSYIYTGSGWDLLARSGEKGDSINWRGSWNSSDEISDPQEFDAYYNYTDGCSYIYMWGNWQKLASKGEDGQDGRSIYWRGEFASSDNIVDPQELDAYYNYTDGCSYIYMWGNWQKLASKGEDGQDGRSIYWRGEFASSDEVSEPSYLDIYYNYADGCSYIYNGSYWTLLAKKGDNGEQGASINWRGEFASSDEVTKPQYLDAYYNYTDGCSYIYMWGGWQTLASKGEQGTSINWRGHYASSDEVTEPQYLDIYYNYTDGCSYIYAWGEWRTLASKGEPGNNGESINWRGSFAASEEITNPQYLDAYFNYKDGCSYIYKSGDWQPLAMAGATIRWLGSYASSTAAALYKPNALDAYFNTTDGCSYIFVNNSWQLLAKAGEKGDTGASGTNGVSIIWKGELEAAPTSPELNWAYYNTTDGCSYLYNGTEWQLLAKAGADGLAGAEGTSISWLGSYASSSEITNPAYLNAYFNTTDGCSYIYNGTEWQLLSRKGSDGTSGGSSTGGIIWLGDFADEGEITNPEVLSAYYNTTTGSSYIYNGTEWKLLAKGGTDGINGEGITWVGSFPSETSIVNPEYMSAYYNTIDGNSYIYNGTKWELLAKAGTNGQTGASGKGINWRGNFANSSFVSSPQYLDAYYNTTENCSYIYINYEWTVLAKGPGSGGTFDSGSEDGAVISGTTLIGWNNPEGVIRIPSGITDISPAVFKNKGITGVVIPSSVKSIGNDAFHDCSNLQSVEFLGTGLQIIGEDAFRSCSTLASITLPNTLQSIGSGAFAYCSNLTTVNIPDKVVSIGAEAYYNCISLRSLSIGRGVTELKSKTFCNCDSLVSITIPSNIKTIACSVFYDCDSIVSLSVSGTFSRGSTVNHVLVLDDLNYYLGDPWTRE
ncbi:leucine-rich repeat protein [uncultured Treponema sp.]|uniref:leucine-rich repeat protein n=1 Tax=uncultured Treponema sp. TaxID=162155 RepID=UPI00260DDC11|nr:leucine-rich repeat protein [uncultured Treponema sp.]